MEAKDALTLLQNKTNGSCTTGCDLSSNLQGEGFVERPCYALTPFFTRWCKTHDKGMGYKAGSFVFDDCGYYFNLVHETRSPRDAKSAWIQFTGLDFALMFASFLSTVNCEEDAIGSQLSAEANSGCAGTFNGETSCS